MALGGLLAAIGGVVLVAGAILFDKLSEKEEHKQQEMKKEYNNYCEKRVEKSEETKKKYKKEYEKTASLVEKDYEATREKLLAEQQKIYRGYIDKMQKNLSEQRKAKQADLEKLLDVLKQWNEIKDTAQSTIIRMKALKRSILSIEEACCKLEAYIGYLDMYEEQMLKSFSLSADFPEPFSMTLPTYFPYPGKLMLLKKKNFKYYNECYHYKPDEDPSLKLFLDFNENKEFENSDYDEMTFMVCAFKNSADGYKISTKLSINRAAIKTSVDRGKGLYCQVIKTGKNWVQLSYNGIYLSLDKSNLNNPNRPVPRGTYLTVYVTDYDFSLSNQHIKVSERREDSLSLQSFEKIGMMLDRANYNMLYTKLKENNWLELDDEWRIGPCDPDNLQSERVKLQMGDYYGYLAEFEDASSANGGKVLKFHRMLDKNEFFKYDDVFAAADVSVECHSPVKAVSEELSSECGYLYTYLKSEFAAQRRILQESPMMLYFDKWLKLTNRLAEVLKFKDRMHIEITAWEQRGRCLYLYIENNKQLKGFLEKGEKSIKPVYLFGIENAGEYKYIRCSIDTEEVIDEICVMVKNISEEDILAQNFAADLVLLTSVYAEQSQAAAFEDFREGKVSSIAIKEALLQTSSLRYNDSGLRINKLKNKQISENQQQFASVSRAFSAEDFFMIQGPPGTGKTTVIKELIFQQLEHLPDSRILVVSQANVAVDNVLRGIVNFESEETISANNIIRCGSDDRIAEDIKFLSYKGRMERYVKDLLKTPAENKELRQSWIDFTNDPENKNIVGECLLKGCRIIGATCVGFSNRSIGLTGLSFDLVIIDEAGKALPGELLITINHAKKLVLIGDHKQLPPVINPELYESGEVETDDVLENDERQDFFNKSFFERLWDDCPSSNKCMLETQFRMPLQISGLVNLFYDGRLSDGDNCLKKKKIAFNSHLVMIDMKDVPEYEEKKESFSGPYNLKEQDVVIEITHKLTGNLQALKRIVVITPYKNQKRQLEKKLRKEGLNKVWVNTIDAFQGDEEEIVIYCMTRAKDKTDYFSDSARLNVAFSRAKNLLIIIGSSDYLKNYGRKHILYRVYKYIKNNSRIIPYADLESMSIEADADYKSNYAETEKQNILNNNDFEKRNEKLFPTEKTEQTSAPKCSICGRTLNEKEEILCSSCMNKAKKCTCEKCQKRFDFPYYIIYIEKHRVPEYCDDCRIIEVKCSQCQKTVRLPNYKYKEQIKSNKKILCNSCLYETDAVCIKCSGTFRVNKNHPHLKSFICSKCRSSVSVKCKCCGQFFELPEFKYDNFKRQNKPLYCSECKQDKKVQCRCCRHYFEMPLYKKQEILNKGQKPYCEICWQKRTYYCNRCGRMDEMPEWKYQELINNGRGCLCSWCRRSYVK